MKFAIYTLGCKVNQYETQALEQLLRQRGHSCVPFHEEADAYIINTCTVTAVSDKKSRQAIRAARKRAPGALVAVCGCYSQTHKAEVEEIGVDLIAGTGERAGFVTLLERAWRERQAIVAVDNAFQRQTFESLPAGGLDGRTRAMLKVEDGCVNFCSFCIIPYARGNVRSLPLQGAVSEATRLAGAGYRELVLTGIEISSWGQDLEGSLSLIDLVEGICRAAPHLRVRLGSLEPRIITPEFCRRAAQLPNLCPHFHLSLQSGSDGVLKRMNRNYDCRRYERSVQLLREFFFEPAITTDLIVGFPGETEEEFQETLLFLRKCAFSSMHIFPYSRRPDTPAARMPGQVGRTAKQERAARAAQAARELEREYLCRQTGQTLDVLFEEERDGLWRGHTARYTQVAVRSNQNLHNVLCPVRITGAEHGMLLGKPAVGHPLASGEGT